MKLAFLATPLLLIVNVFADTLPPVFKLTSVYAGVDINYRITQNNSKATKKDFITTGNGSLPFSWGVNLGYGKAFNAIYLGAEANYSKAFHLTEVNDPNLYGTKNLNYIRHESTLGFTALIGVPLTATVMYIPISYYLESQSNFIATAENGNYAFINQDSYSTYSHKLGIGLGGRSHFTEMVSVGLSYQYLFTLSNDEVTANNTKGQALNYTVKANAHLINLGLKVHF